MERCSNDRVATERGHSRHAAVVAEHLGPERGR